MNAEVCVKGEVDQGGHYVQCYCSQCRVKPYPKLEQRVEDLERELNILKKKVARLVEAHRQSD